MLLVLVAWRPRWSVSERIYVCLVFPLVGFVLLLDSFYLIYLLLRLLLLLLTVIIVEILKVTLMIQLINILLFLNRLIIKFLFLINPFDRVVRGLRIFINWILEILIVIKRLLLPSIRLIASHLRVKLQTSRV